MMAEVGLVATCGRNVEWTVDRLNAELSFTVEKMVESPEVVGGRCVHAQTTALQCEASCDSIECDELAGYSAEILARRILSLLRIPSCHVCLFELDPEDALVTVLRAALLSKLPSYFEKRSSHTHPVFYLSSQSSFQSERLCAKLGLPYRACRTVPSNTQTGSPVIMDMTELSRMVAADVEAGRAPFCVVLQAGISEAQHTDNIPIALQICKRYEIWSHVHGRSTSLLLTDSPYLAPACSAIQHASSYSVAIQQILGESWSDINSPMCTILNTPLPPSVPLPPLPLAGVLTALLLVMASDEELMRSRIATAYDSANHLTTLLSGSEYVEFPLIDPTAQHVVVLQPTLPPHPMISDELALLLLNSRLQTLFASHSVPPGLFLESLGTGTARSYLIVFDPLRLSKRSGKSPLEPPFSGVEDENSEAEAQATEQAQHSSITVFVERLLDVLEATASIGPQRDIFLEAAQSESSRLELVDVPDFEGLGVLRVVPDALEANDSAGIQGELNDFNTQLAEALTSRLPHLFCRVLLTVTIPPKNHNVEAVFVGVRQIDPYTSRPGDPTSPRELLAAMMGTARELEARTTVEALSGSLREAIQQAEGELEQRRQREWEETGVLRNIPLVGGLWQYWSPPPEKAPTEGVKFELRTPALKPSREPKN